MASLDEVKQLMSTILNEISNLPQKLLVTGVQIKVTALSEISNVLGVMQAGEFRSGNSKDPGRGFSGVRLGYPPFSYSGEMWNFAGVNNDVLQFGISATTGKAYAAGGKVILDANGVTIQADETAPYLTFKDENGSEVATIFQDGAENLQFDQATPGKLFTFNDGNVVCGRHSSGDPAFAFHYAWTHKGQMWWDTSHNNIIISNDTNTGNILVALKGDDTDENFAVWNATAAESAFFFRLSGGFHMRSVSSDPAYVDDFACMYYYSDGAGTDEVRIRGKIGATETQVTIADLSP